MINKKIKNYFIASLVALSIPFSAQATAPLGKTAPEFSASTADGRTVKLSDFKGKVVVLEWTNPECPFVRKHYESKNIPNLQREYTSKGVVWLTVNSSAKGKQGYFEGQGLINQIKKDGNLASAYIKDESGKLGVLYDAKTTPHFFIINKEGVLVYNGAIDSINSTKVSDISKAQSYVRANLDAVLAGKVVPFATTTPYGCGIKYAQVKGYEKKTN